MKNTRGIILKIVLIFIALLAFLYVYVYDPFYFRDSEVISNVRVFKTEEFWPLAIAVDKGDVNKIQYFSEKHYDWINKKGSKFDISLLYFAITTEKYESAEALLKVGADPNLRMMKLGGQTALYDASCFSSVDNNANKDPKFVNLLLKYGADPNLYYLGGEDVFSNSTEIGDSPLIHSIGCGIEKTRALIDAGAEISHSTFNGKNVLIQSLNYSDLDGVGLIQLSYDLIMAKKIDLHQCIFHSEKNNYCLPDVLRNLIFRLDSEKYKIKRQIIDELTKNGIDYWNTPIPERRLDQIKRLYPDTWQEYIKKY